ncbi:MAG: tetratricopeptide repeat protein [bacterium]
MGEVEARPFLEEGEEHLAAGDYAAAQRAFERAVEAAPDLAVAHSKVGVTLAHQGQHDAAIARFSKALQLQPGYAPAYSNLGNAYKAKGMLVEAVAAYQRALAIDPEYWIAHQNLGVVYKEMGRIGESVDELKKATRLSIRQRPRPPAGKSPRGCLGSAGAVLVVLLGGVAALAVTGVR